MKTKKIILNNLLLFSILFSSLNAEKFKGSISKITPEIKARMTHSWKDDSPVSLTDLRYIQVLHYDFDGKIKKGELVMHKNAAYDILAIFAELFEIKFPIKQMKLVDEYDGDDDISMATNNTYAHCTRTVARETRWSNHAYGLAIDINPQQNPYIRDSYICPLDVNPKYLDRSRYLPGMILKDSPIYKIFIKYGWEWGGECLGYCQDLHHFQKVIPGLNKTRN